MRKIRVYLAGPITGLKYGKANDWRKYVADKLPKWIVAVSPMRHENCDARGRIGIIKNQPEEFILRYQKKITNSCRNDIKNCDIVIVNFLGSKTVSIGTIIEFGWADILKKPLIVAMKKSNIHSHVMTKEIPNHIYTSLNETIDAVIKLAKRLHGPANRVARKPVRRRRLGRPKSTPKKK